MENQDHGVESPSDASASTAIDDVENQEEVAPLRRRGDVHKCPVCGSHVDEGAYHCSACRNYFCFHCRARLSPQDVQLQCVNQHCDYYGKLVCDVCDPSQQQEEAPMVYAEPEDGYWPGWLVLALIAFGIIWYRDSLTTASLAALALFFVGGGILHLAGLNIFGRNRIVEHPRKSTFYSCISCGQVVKKIQKAK